ncbi:MAG TPA: YHS domain-containing protein [Terriglobales bacterium]|nr:YHS domain-containing protein [Terriglobales bacterium]
MAEDPVCGMDIDESKAAGSSEHNGQEFYFCSLQCKQKFDENPNQYARKTA